MPHSRSDYHFLPTAVQSSAIVSSLFPANVRDRLFQTEGPTLDKPFEPTKLRLKTFLNEGKSEFTTSSTKREKDKPIADLFPETTVMFGDIAGFTAWASIREPSQVFHLLETIYSAFDAIAMRRNVFKIETIGDSYVAVCGLPEPRAG